MTDGTPASIAANIVTMIEKKGIANMTWVAQSLRNILGGDISSFPMPSTYPGAMNPLLWWYVTCLNLGLPLTCKSLTLHTLKKVLINLHKVLRRHGR